MSASDENLYGRDAAKYYDIVAYYDYDKVAKSLASSIKGKRVLELGVGTGLVTFRMAKLGFHVDGIDNSIYMVAAAKKKLVKENKAIRRRVRLYHQSASSIKLKGPYDAVISQGAVLTCFGPVVESYLKTKEANRDLLKKAFEILREGGSLIINIQEARQKIKKAELADGYSYTGTARRKGGMLFVTHVIKKNDKIAVRQTFEKLFLTKAEFEKMASAAGFKIVGPNRSGLHYILTK